MRSLGAGKHPGEGTDPWEKEQSDERQEAEAVDRGPGVRIPRQYGVARVGLGPIGTHLLMRFHDGESDHRKVAGFRLIHDASAGMAR